MNGWTEWHSHLLSYSLQLKVGLLIYPLSFDDIPWKLVNWCLDSLVSLQLVWQSGDHKVIIQLEVPAIIHMTVICTASNFSKYSYTDF